MRSEARCRAVDGLVAAIFLVVPLAWSPSFVDWFTTAKWYALHLLTAAWLLAEVWLCGSARWPAFVRDHRWAVGALAALGAWSVFRGGVAWAMSPLADRLACAALALCAAWYFARNRGRAPALVLALAVSAALTIGAGFVQASWPEGSAEGEGPAAFFGNVNMAAQFIGLALLAMVYAPPDVFAERWRAAWRAARIALGLFGLAYLYLLSSRSVLLALVVAAVCAGARRRPIALAGASAAAAVLALVWLQPGAHLDPTLAARKADSAAFRLALWSDTLDMIRDRPLGAGAGNFEHAFLPYQARGRLEPQETLVFRSPHDEYLRLLAEDGILFCAVGVIVGLLLAARFWRGAGGAPDIRPLVAAWVPFLAVEAAFQFPLALAFGALAASITVGAMLAAVEPETSAAAPRRSTRWRWRAGGTAASLVLIAASFRVSVSELLLVRAPHDLGAQSRACGLDARNLPACVTAAWLEARGGDGAAARARLARVLRDAPTYPPALRLLGQMALLEKDDAEACRILSAYDALYKRRSSLHGRAESACARARGEGER